MKLAFLLIVIAAALTALSCITHRSYASSDRRSSDSRVKLKAGDLVVAFDPTHHGGITSVRHGSAEIVKPSWSSPTLFKLGVVHNDQVAYFTNLDFDEFTWEDAEGVLRFRFKGLKDGTQVAVMIAAQSAGDHISFQCTVDSGPDVVCSEIMYPYISGYESLSDDPGSDRYMYPHLTGEWHIDPVRELRSERKSFFGTQGYPGTQGVQFHSLHNARHGIVMYTPDPDSNPKWFTLHNDKTSNSIAWTVRHYFDESPGFRFEPRYEVRLQACGPSWYDAADIYAAWGRNQWWMSKKRPRPDWLQKLPLMANVHDNDRFTRSEPMWFAEHQPEMNALLGDRELIHTFWHWEHYGHWVAPDSFPPVGGEEAMLQASKEVRSWGKTHLRHMFSCGQYWLHKDITDEIFDSEIMKMAELPRGEIRKSRLIKHHDYISDFVRCCPSSEDFQKKLLHLVSKLVEYHHDVISMDIWPLGQPNPCYNPQHPHPPGLGHWYVDANMDMLDKMHEIVYAKEPDAVFGGESMAEPYLPWMHMTLMRTASAPVSRGKGGRIKFIRVPMFDYIYGDQVVEWSDWAMSQIEQCKAQVGLHFVRGNIIHIEDKFHHKYFDIAAMDISRIRQAEEPVPKIKLRVKLGDAQLREENLKHAAMLNDIQRGEFSPYFSHGRGWRYPKSFARAATETEWRRLDIYDTDPAIGALRHPESDRVLWAISNSRKEKVSVRLQAIEGKSVVNAISKAKPKTVAVGDREYSEIDLEPLEVALIEWE